MSFLLTSCFTSSFGKTRSIPRSDADETDERGGERFEFSAGRKSTPAGEEDGDIGSGIGSSSSEDFYDRILMRMCGKSRSFRWSRLEETPRSSVWSRLGRLVGLEKDINLVLNTHHQRSASTVQNGGSYDSGGYVNHGFSDTQAPPPHPAQMAQFRTELAGVRSELLQLHDVLMASNSAESGITQTVSDYAISSSTQVINESRNVDSSRQTTFSITDDKLLKSTTNSTENLNRLLTVRKEAMDACLADNAELRQTVGELTASLKQLQLENENLRQRLGAPDGVSNGVGGGGGDASAAKVPRTWSFSSESIPNTPCSPIEIGTRQNNYRVINGEPYTTLS